MVTAQDTEFHWNSKELQAMQMKREKFILKELHYNRYPNKRIVE